MRHLLVFFFFINFTLSLSAQGNRRPRIMREFTTDTAMVHDPVMAFENGTYYLLSTGRRIQIMTSTDRKSWKFKPHGVMDSIPAWTQTAVPGFRDHVWAPDIIQWHGKWWLMYSCSTFGKNTSAIGLLTTNSLADPIWKDEGCVVKSKTEDPFNAIDPNIVIDDKDRPWLTFGSFWDGIQMVKLDENMHIAKKAKPKTIARRYGSPMPNLENPTSKYAGVNAIEAPFIFKHNGWYYLFVSWDYCCRGAKSNYRVVVGRSKKVNGPYRDREGKDMRKGGGTLFLEGDKKEFEAAGHCSAYHFEGKDIFVCHGYSVPLHGQSILVQREMQWTADGWPYLP
ncbi:MAG: family 43 glycosylhydrolase [Prevotella sp.]|nr:family 43 glycosylhydrolase [Prevotella sp.]